MAANMQQMEGADIGVNFEREAVNRSRDQAHYEAQMSNKTNEFFRWRQANELNRSDTLQRQLAQQQPMVNQDAAMQGQMGWRMAQNRQHALQQLQHQKQNGDTNWSTISRDCTMDPSTRENELLRYFGQRLKTVAGLL